MARAALGILYLTVPLLALAQGVEHVAYFDTQALRYSTRGEVTACGVRIMGARASMSEAFDTSVNIRKSERGLFGIVKFLSLNVALKDGAPSLIPVRLRSAWIREREGSAIRFSNDPLRGDDGASILYSVPPEDAAALLLAIMKRESIYIALKRESASAETVFSGPIKLTDQDAEEIARCVSEIRP